MHRLLIFAAFLQLSSCQQYQQKVAPGVPPQNYQNYQQPPPPPSPQQQQYQPPPPQQQQQYQPPPPQQQQQQQQYQPPPPQQQQYQQPQVQDPHGHHDPQLLNPANIAQERDHIQEHIEVPIDTSKMSEQELQFHYFKMHDADNNNKLDGCELIKSLIHWHAQEKPCLKLGSYCGQVDKSQNVYSDAQLATLTDHALKHTDYNDDGYVDYLEYRVNMYKAKAQANQEKKKKN